MRRKWAILSISYLSCAVVALGIFSWVQYNRAETYNRQVAASYQHAFAELVTSMSEIDTALQKSLYATSPTMAGAICTEVFGKAMTAQMTLGVLPFSTQELEQTASFISRVGDYAYSLSRSALRGGTYSDEERENLRALSDTATLLAQNLTELQADMADGHLTMGELRDSEARMDAVEEEAAPSTLGESMRLIEQEFPEVPSLIYDGPFSEHLTSVEPRMLGQTLKVDSERARKIAANFIGLPEARVSLTGKSEGGTMPCYYFSADADGGELMVEVSQQGGLVVNMLGTRRPESREIEAEEAVELAKGFLLRKGYENMAESYYMIQDNVLTANFAYMDGDVLCYSDLVKVSVALDNGAILGFEAKGYLTAHYDREIPEAAVSLEDARTLVSPELEILSEGLAIIPTAGQYESFCYEFKCAAEGDRHYIVYVNAVTGDQERILILLEDENGTLTL